MNVTVAINTCNECRFRDHSGAFTKGGAKPICGGPGASVYTSRAKGLKRTSYHWKHRVLPNEPITIYGRPYHICTDKIPNWCPLRNGESYR